MHSSIPAASLSLLSHMPRGLQYGIQAENTEDLDEEQASALLEAYAADKTWSAKVCDGGTGGTFSLPS